MYYSLKSHVVQVNLNDVCREESLRGNAGSAGSGAASSTKPKLHERIESICVFNLYPLSDFFRRVSVPRYATMCSDVPHAQAPATVLKVQKHRRRQRRSQRSWQMSQRCGNSWDQLTEVAFPSLKNLFKMQSIQQDPI